MGEINHKQQADQIKSHSGHVQAVKIHAAWDKILGKPCLIIDLKIFDFRSSTCLLWLSASPNEWNWDAVCWQWLVNYSFCYSSQSRIEARWWIKGIEWRPICAMMDDCLRPCSQWLLWRRLRLIPLSNPNRLWLELHSKVLKAKSNPTHVGLWRHKDCPYQKIYHPA